MAASSPAQVRWGLRIAWLALLISYGITLWFFLAETGALRTLGWNGPSLSALAQAALGLMRTPYFISFPITALLLGLLMCRIGWVRWIFVLGATLSLMLFVRSVLTQPSQGMIVYVRCVLVLANCTAIGLLFTRPARAWFATPRSAAR